MARSFSVIQITPSAGPGSPARVLIPGNLVTSFQGKFYRQKVPPYTTQAFYTAVSAPVGYALIAATTFDIENNASYAGRYTVYTPVSLVDSATNPSSQFTGGDTEIRVNEAVGAPLSPGDLTTGTVTNISTYLIPIAGEASLLIPPGVTFTDRPIDLIGRNGSPWGESYSENFIELAQNFASASAPANPYLGQTWYDSALNAFNLRTASGWTTLASGAPGANTTFRYTQAAASSVWSVNHSLALLSPFVAIVQFFVEDTPGVWKMIVPSDLTFNSASQLTATFSSPRSGIALIRA